MTQYTRHTQLYTLLLASLVTLLLMQVAQGGRNEQLNLSAPGMAVALLDPEQQEPVELEFDDHYLLPLQLSIFQPSAVYSPEQRPVGSPAIRLITWPPSRASPHAV